MISLLVLSFIFSSIYIEEAFVGFFPLGFSPDKSLCSFCMVVLIYLFVVPDDPTERSTCINWYLDASNQKN